MPDRDVKGREALSARSLIEEIAARLEREGRLGQTRQYIQHGQWSVYDHCLNVADMSLRLAGKLHVRVDEAALVRGALLHDYFLYDWHKPDPHRRKHAFFHPSAAWQNASRDYPLGPVEEDIIRHHMFPVVPVPPRTAEGWIVCLADTICAVKETLGFR